MTLSRTLRDSRRRLVVAVVISVSLSMAFATQGLADSDDSDDDWDHFFYYEDVDWHYTVDDEPWGPEFTAVNKLRWLGILDGTDCGPKRFCPDDPATREALAVWLVRLVDGPDAPGLLAARERFDSGFADVAADLAAGPLIDRLVELDIAGGCGTDPDRFCPAGGVNRGQLAAAVSRALNLPAPEESFGFWDVDPDRTDHVDRYVDAGFDRGCGGGRLVPREFCPGETLTRGQLAQVLAQVADYVSAPRINPEPDALAVEDIGLVVSHRQEDRNDIVHITWDNPAQSQPVQYIVQWRPTWIGFNHQRYQTVEYSANSSYSIELSRRILANAYRRHNIYSAIEDDPVYAVRVIAVYSHGLQRATPEVTVNSPDNRLRDLIKTEVIDAHADAQPWLADVWTHLDGPRVRIRVVPYSFWCGATAYGSLASGLTQQMADTMHFNHSQSQNVPYYAERGHMSGDLATAYILTSGIAQDGAPIAAGWLYLWQLQNKYRDGAKDPTRCINAGLYSDLAIMAHNGRYGDFNPRYGQTGRPANSMGYWQLCGMQIEDADYDQIKRDVTDLAKSVYVDQTMPAWFIDRYQSGGETDLDKLWADISDIPHHTRGHNQIIYGFRNSFGGYCDEEAVRLYETGKIDSIPTPWRDAGGCLDEPPQQNP